MKLAFVVQRYGTEVAGGAELHCRWLAERLALSHEVHVFTTRALDYADWHDSYPGGEARLNGVTVHRFPVARKRNLRAFRAISDRVFRGPHDLEDEQRWFEENGPFSPRLVSALSAARDEFDLFFFYSFRYYHSYAGARVVGGRAILIPTAEDDPAVHLEAVKPLFRDARGIVYLTPEEKALVEGATGVRSARTTILGSGLNLYKEEPGVDFRSAHGIAPRFLLYLGRVDRNKGCLTLLAYFRRFLEETGADVDLVLAGHSALRLPREPRVHHVGPVSEAEKASALSQAEILVMPSFLESLSIVVLEAWAHGRPVLANARCAVLEGQCRRSNGGLYYRGFEEFRSTLSLLLAEPTLARRLGAQGRDFVGKECSWEAVESRLSPILSPSP